MGNQESSSVKSTEQKKDILNQVSGERGHNVSNEFVEANISEVDSKDSFSLAETESDFDSDSDTDDELENDEELMERLRILEDARKLKQLAVAFLHPEKPVEVDASACARCYFDRPSAPETESAEEAKYRDAILEDAAALKRLAVDYTHPELGVVTSDPTATARCYFDRPSAPEQESMEDAEERAIILEDAKKLREAALQYLHPELGVVTSDPTATARCYFDRPSAPEQESIEDAEERAMILEEAAALKRLAVDYMHPELGVVTSDPTATARCYFDRPSACHEFANISQPKEIELQIKSKVKTVPVVKNVGVKTLETKLEGIIRKSASAVQLYGLDDDHGDDTF